MVCLQDLADCEIIMRFALTKPGGGVVFLTIEKPVNFYLFLLIAKKLATRPSGGNEKNLPIHSQLFSRRQKKKVRCKGRRIFRVIS